MTVTVLLALAALLWTRDHGTSSESGPTPPSGPALSARSWYVRLRGVSRARGSPDDGWVADLAEVAAIGLRAGLSLQRAALVAARSPGVARAAPALAGRLGEAERRGASLAEMLDDVGRGLGAEARADLAVVARSWRLSEDTGAAASHTTAAAAAAVRARSEAVGRAEAALAGPRASMRVLTALPLAGPVVGLLVGMPPARLYDAGPAQAAALAGLLLTATGWWWARSLVARAARPLGTDGRTR